MGNSWVWHLNIWKILRYMLICVFPYEIETLKPKLLVPRDLLGEFMFQLSSRTCVFTNKQHVMCHCNQLMISATIFERGAGLNEVLVISFPYFRKTHMAMWFLIFSQKCLKPPTS